MTGIQRIEDGDWCGGLEGVYLARRAAESGATEQDQEAGSALQARLHNNSKGSRLTPDSRRRSEGLRTRGGQRPTRRIVMVHIGWMDRVKGRERQTNRAREIDRRTEREKDRQKKREKRSVVFFITFVSSMSAQHLQ